LQFSAAHLFCGFDGTGHECALVNIPHESDLHPAWKAVADLPDQEPDAGLERRVHIFQGGLLMNWRFKVAVLLVAGVSSTVVRAQEVSPQIVARINAIAEARFPDRPMQTAFVAGQIASYRFLLMYTPPDMPADSLQRVKQGIHGRFPDDYRVQQQLVQWQVNSYRSIDTYRPAEMAASDLGEVKARLRKRYPDDYSTQWTLLEGFGESYAVLKAYAPEGIPADIVASIKQKLAKRYPYDYSVQRQVIETEIKSYLDRKGQ
jgi:hypothetical protein